MPNCSQDEQHSADFDSVFPICVTFGLCRLCAVNGRSTLFSNGQKLIIALTAAVGGFGRAATAGVKGETSGHVTVWAFNGLSRHCCYSEDTQLWAHVCDARIDLDPRPPAAPTGLGPSAWRESFCPQLASPSVPLCRGNLNESCIFKNVK